MNIYDTNIDGGSNNVNTCGMSTIQLLTQAVSDSNPIIRQFDAILNTLVPGIDIMIAGGSVRNAFYNEEMGKSDYDLFFKSDEDLERAVKQVKSMGFLPSRHPNCTAINLTPEKSFGKLKVPPEGMHIQFITKDKYHTMEQLLGNFDFTICQFGYKNGTIYYTPEALQHANEKRLSLNSHKENIFIAPARVLKFIQRGFSPDRRVFTEFFVNEREYFSRYTCEISEYDTLYGGI